MGRILTLVFIIVLIGSTEVRAELEGMDRLEAVSEEKAGVSFNTLLEDITSGNTDVLQSDISELITGSVRRYIKSSKSLLRQTVLLVILCSLMSLMAESVEGRGMAELGIYIGWLMIAVAVVSGFDNMLSIAVGCMTEVVDIINAAVPFMCGLLTLSGRAAQAAGFGMLLSLATEVITAGIESVAVTFIKLYVAAAIVNTLSGRAVLSKLTVLIEDVARLVIRGAAALFIFIVALERITGGMMNKAIAGTARSVIGMVPIVGDVLNSGADVVANTTEVLGNGAGIAISILLISACCVPLAGLLTTAMLYRLAAALVEPIADKAATEMVDIAGRGGMLVFSAVFTVLFMFVTGVLITITALGG
jgi:stage III sporulation protein AE